MPAAVRIMAFRNSDRVSYAIYVPWQGYKLPRYRVAEKCSACGGKSHALTYSTRGWFHLAGDFYQPFDYPWLYVSCATCGCSWARGTVPSKKAAAAA